MSYTYPAMAFQASGCDWTDILSILAVIRAEVVGQMMINVLWSDRRRGEEIG